MGEIMKSATEVKSCVPERVSISCPTCGTRHDTKNTSYVTVCEQTLQHLRHRSVKCVKSILELVSRKNSHRKYRLLVASGGAIRIVNGDGCHINIIHFTIICAPPVARA